MTLTTGVSGGGLRQAALPGVRVDHGGRRWLANWSAGFAWPPVWPAASHVVNGSSQDAEAVMRCVAAHGSLTEPGRSSSARLPAPARAACAGGCDKSPGYYCEGTRYAAPTVWWCVTAKTISWSVWARPTSDHVVRRAPARKRFRATANRLAELMMQTCAQPALRRLLQRAPRALLILGHEVRIICAMPVSCVCCAKPPHWMGRLADPPMTKDGTRAVFVACW